MASALPTLSTSEGFVTTPSSLVIKLFEYFLTSEYSQSNTFLGEIASLKYILSSSETQDDMVNSIKETLTIMYNRYFTNTTVEVTVEEDGGLSLYLIDIAMTGSDNVSYRLSKEITSIGDKITNMDTLLEDLKKYN